MSVQRVVNHVTVTASKVTLAFGASSAEYLYEPFSLVRHEPIDDNRWAVVVSTNSGLRAYLVTDDAYRALENLPRTWRGDPMLDGSKVESMIGAVRSAHAGQPDASGQPKPLAPPSQGALSTDGTFLTLEVNDARTHYVVARDALPQLQGTPVLGPDGSLAVTLHLPDRSVAIFRVAPENAVELEKAVALLRSYEPPPPPARAVASSKPGSLRPSPASAASATKALREHPNGTLILVFGILGLITCGPLAIAAWVMGNSAQREMDSQRNVTWTNRSNVNAGRMCGIVGTWLWIVFGLLWLVLIAAASG